MAITTTAKTSSSFFGDMLAPLVLALRLFARYWPQLVLIAALGLALRGILLYFAVEVGMNNALAGMGVLSLVVLVKLIVVVLMCTVMRPDLPAIERLGKPVTTAPATSQDNRTKVTSVVALAVLPFFAYYAAWGFLGDTVREYSREALVKVPFGEGAHFLDLLQSRYLVASIVACWILRWGVKQLKQRTDLPFLAFLIVALDATWIFIGLYGISIWQDELVAWIGSGGFFRALPDLKGISASLSIEAFAATGFVPVEFQSPGFLLGARRLFFFALLPLVWLLMVAVIYGFDAKTDDRPFLPKITLTGWRKWIADFFGHFFGGYRSRYMPVFRVVRMVLGAGAATLITAVIGYQFISWMGAWLWVGATRLIGAQELITWQLIGHPISLLIGDISDLDGGILLDPLRICLLAAVVERAVAARQA